MEERIMWEDEVSCPVCNSMEMVYPIGPKKSPILIIGEAPGDDEIRDAKPFVGRTGTVLRTELGRLGIDLGAMRITNMWRHPKTDNEKCFQHCFTKAIEDAQGRKAILLIGAGTLKKFCGHGVEDYNGLLVKSNWLSAPFVMASVQPAVVWNENGTLGEVRFVMKKFAELIEKEGLL
jgi:uracil-DNA glycosylase family 4